MSEDRELSLETLLDARVRISPRVVLRAFEGETIVLDLDSGKYHSLNASGGRFLEVLSQAPTVRAGLAQLRDEFADAAPDVLRDDLHRFCVELAGMRLVQVEPGGADADNV